MGYVILDKGLVCQFLFSSSCSFSRDCSFFKSCKHPGEFTGGTFTYFFLLFLASNQSSFGERSRFDVISIVGCILTFKGIMIMIMYCIVQVLKVLSASPSAYSANPKVNLSSPLALIGSSISLVSRVQVWLFNNFQALQ